MKQILAFYIGNGCNLHSFVLCSIFQLGYKFHHGSIRTGKINCNVGIFLWFTVVKKIHTLDSKEGKLWIKNLF